MEITIGTTYYNNPGLLKRFIERNISFVDELIIVDDGSSLPASDYIDKSEKIKLYRVTKDYGFNSHGCRNLIMTQSTNDWVILIDIDREFSDPAMSYNIIKTSKLKRSTLYRFIAHSNNTGAHHSVNDYLIHRSHFFSAGGYDEELIGERWGDREYFEQLKHYGTEKTLYGVDLNLLRSPSVHLKINSPNDKRTSAKNVELVQSRILNPDPNKPILTFDWELVF